MTFEIEIAGKVFLVAFLRIYKKNTEHVQPKILLVCAEKPLAVTSFMKSNTNTTCILR